MTKQEYEGYLQSDTWKEIRQKRLEFDNRQCVCCCGTENLRVHHITYDRVGGSEYDYDLITLCDDCHRRLHEMQDAEKPEFDSIMKAFKDECAAAIAPIVVKYYHLIQQKYGRILYDLCGKHKGHLRRESFYKAVETALGIYQLHSIDVPFRIPQLITKNLHGQSLYRILKGKKKYCGCDTVDQWEGQYIELQKRVEEGTWQE